MSLINDALKKAQRLRTEDATADTPTQPAAAGGQIAKRGEARSANTIVLIGGGVLLLLLLSVALTIYLFKRPTAPAAVPVAATPPTTAPAPSPSPTVPAPSPTIPVVAPPTDASAATPPVVAPKTEKAPIPTAVEPKSVAVTPPAPQSAAPVSPPPKTEPTQPPVTQPAPVTPVASAPAVAPPSPASTAKADDRVTAYIETLKVTGIRSSGTESRVLMNERVYRVNDFVDRTLGIRLTKVAVDSLTFSDANGVSYIKYF